MPTIRGIRNNIETCYWDGVSLDSEGKIVCFPEYLYPEAHPRPAAAPGIPGLPDPDTYSIISVYIPLLPKATAFQIGYSFIPEYPEGIRFEYKVFFNGREIVSADVKPQKVPSGTISKTIADSGPSNHQNAKTRYEQFGFKFTSPKGLLFRSTADDGGCIEVRWHRVQGSIPSEPNDLQHSKSMKDRFQVGFRSFGKAVGVLHRTYYLIDPVDAPWATFRFYYRSAQSLRDNHIMVDDNYEAGISKDSLLGDASRSLLSFCDFDEPTPSPRRSLGMVISQPFNFKPNPSSEGVVARCVPLELAQISSFSGSVIHHNIANTTQGRIVAQNNANNQRRATFQGEGAPNRTNTTHNLGVPDLINRLVLPAPRSGANTLLNTMDNTDRLSMASLTPSLKECVDREDGDKENYVVGIARAIDLTSPKRRRKHGNGHHTGISAQFAGLKAHDESSSILNYSSDQDNEGPCTPRRQRPTGIYQHDNMGLPHYGEHGFSSRTMSGQEASSVIDEDFAASEYAPPTRGIMSAANSSPPPPQFLTLKRSSAGLLIESSPVKSPPPGVDYPVDSPGSTGFPVIEPGGHLSIVAISLGEGFVPDLSVDGGESSVIHYTPRPILPNSKKPLAYLQNFGGMGRQLSPSLRISSSPLAEIDELQLNGNVKRVVTEYESPKDIPPPNRRSSLTLPPGRVVVPVVVRGEAKGEIAQPTFVGALGKLKATPSLIAFQDKRMSQAKSMVADLKSQLEAHQKPVEGGGADGDEASGEELLADINDQSWAAGDENIEVSSPVRRVSRAAHRSKDAGKNTWDDVFNTTGGDVEAPRRRPSSEDDPDHPHRRRSSTTVTTAHDWLSSGLATVTSPLKSSLKRVVSAVDSKEKFEAGRRRVASSTLPPSMDKPIAVGAHFVPNPVSTPELAADETDPNANSMANDNLQSMPTFDYASRVAPIVPIVSSSNGGGNLDAKQPSLASLFFDTEAMRNNLKVVDEMKRDGAALLQTAAVKWSVVPLANVVEAVSSPADRNSAAPAAFTASANANVAVASCERQELKRNCLNESHPDPAGWVPHHGHISNPNGPLRDDGTVWKEIKQYNASSNVAAGNMPYIQEDQLDEYRAKPHDWLSMSIKLHHSKIKAEASVKGKKKEAQQGEEEVRQDVRESLEQAYATFPDAQSGGSGSVQCAESSPTTPREPVSATIRYPVRRSSLMYSPARNLNVTPTRPTTGCLVSAVSPAQALHDAVYTGHAHPPAAEIDHAHPPQSPLVRSPSVIDHAHPLRSPVARSQSVISRDNIKIVSITRSPSGLVTTITHVARTDGNAGHSHPHIERAQIDAAHGHPVPKPVSSNKVIETQHGHLSPTPVVRQEEVDAPYGNPSLALVHRPDAVDASHGHPGAVPAAPTGTVNTQHGHPTPASTGHVPSLLILHAHPHRTPCRTLDRTSTRLNGSGEPFGNFYDATPPGSPTGLARHEPTRPLTNPPSPTPATQAIDTTFTAGGVPIRDASNAANLFHHAPVFPSFSAPPHISGPSMRSPETPVPGAWPKIGSEKGEDDEESVLHTPGKYEDLYKW